MRPTRVIKSVLTAALILFIVLNVHFMFQPAPHTASDDAPGLVNKVNQNLPVDIVQDTQKIANKNLHLDVTSINQNIKGNAADQKANETKDKLLLNRTEIKSAIMQRNLLQKVNNLEKYGLHLNSDGVVIVIQVHNRLEYLKHLIKSLRAVRDISDALVIFSHDVYSTELNSIIKTIDFCPVMQIFYPYSIQVYPEAFPGTDPNDCARDITKVKALKTNCNNAEHPDRYGHYREAKYTQTKHHWFWKLHRVFDELTVTKTYDGPVVLLEEDHYVTPDFIYMLKLMYSKKDPLCKECNIFTLGNYDKKPSFIFNDIVHTTGWVSSLHNMAMSLKRETWQEIKNCSKEFCMYDDYNWDWSLQFISTTSCLSNKLQVMYAKSTRVFHIGECGVHHKGKVCNPDQKVTDINKLIKDNRNSLFPTDLRTQPAGKSKIRMSKPNGGWGDIRDHQLCISFIQDKKRIKR